MFYYTFFSTHSVERIYCVYFYGTPDIFNTVFAVCGCVVDRQLWRSKVADPSDKMCLCINNPILISFSGGFLSWIIRNDKFRFQGKWRHRDLAAVALARATQLQSWTRMGFFFLGGCDVKVVRVSAWKQDAATKARYVSDTRVLNRSGQMPKSVSLFSVEARHSLWLEQHTWQCLGCLGCTVHEAATQILDP